MNGACGANPHCDAIRHMIGIFKHSGRSTLGAFSASAFLRTCGEADFAMPTLI